MKNNIQKYKYKLVFFIFYQAIFGLITYLVIDSKESMIFLLLIYFEFPISLIGVLLARVLNLSEIFSITILWLLGSA